MSKPLRLKAEDAEDVAILSACLQDALVMVEDMAFEPEDRRFLLVASRFQWEQTTRPPGATDPAANYPFSRIKAGLGIENVTRVTRRNLDLQQRETFLSLLAIEADGSNLSLIFANDVAIRLEVSQILCHLRDMGEAWPTPWCPVHEAGQPGR